MATSFSRGPPRWLVLLAVAVIVLPLALVLAVWGALTLPPVRGTVADFLAKAVSAPGAVVTIGGIEGPLPRAPVLRNVRVADADGSWLTLDTLAVEWKPLELLSGRLHIERVAAGHLVVARLPETPTSSDGARVGIPRLPLAISVGKLSVDTLHLGAAVLGKPAVFAIDGQLAAAQDGLIESRLDIIRRDGGAGDIRMRAILDPDRRALDLDVRLDEPEGGLAATLLDLPGLPAVRVTLNGAGAVDAWMGRLAVNIPGLFATEADIAIDAAPLLDSRAAFDAAVSGHVTHGLDLGPAVTRALSDTVTLSADVSFDGDAWRLGIDRLAVAAGPIAIDAHGSLGLDDLAMDLRVSLRATDPAAVAGLVPDLRLSALSAELTLGGTAAQPELTLHAIASEVAVGAVAAGTLVIDAVAAADRPITDPGASMVLDAAVTTTAVSGLPEIFGPTQSARLGATLSPSNLVLDIADLSAAAGPLSAGATGTVLLNSGAADLALSLRLDDLAVVTAGEAGGTADLRAQLRGNIHGGEVTVSVAGNLDNLQLAPPITAAVGDRLVFSAEVLGIPGGLWAARDVAVQGAHLTLTGNVDVDPAGTTFGAAFGLRLAELDRLSAAVGVDVGGSLDVTGNLVGPFSSPRLQASARIADGRTGDVSWSRLAAKVDLAVLPATPRGRVSVEGAGSYGAFNAAAEVAAWDGSSLRLANISAKGMGLHVTGALTVPPAGNHLAGRLRAEAASLAAAAALAGIEAEGSGAVTLDLSGASDGQRFAATVALRDLTLRQDGAGVTTFDAIDFSAEGDADPLAFKFTASLAGERAVPINLEVAGAFRADDVGFAVTLSQVNGQVAGHNLAQRRAATLRLGPAGLSVENLDLAVADGRLNGGLSLTDVDVDADLTATGMPLDLLRLVLPDLGISGVWDARLRLAGVPSGPDGSLTATAREVAFADPTLTDLPALSLTMTGRLAGDRLILEAVAAGLPKTAASAHLEIPLRLSLQPVAIDLPAAEPIDGRLVVDGDITPVWQLLPIDPHQLAGRVDVDLAVAGTLGEPRVSGRTTLSGGRYENLETGTLLTNLAAEAVGDGQRILLVRASAADGNGGSLAASGSLDLVAGGAPALDLAVNLSGFRLIQRDEIMVISSGTLGLGGTLAALRLSGTIVTDLIEVRLTDKLPPQVITLEVTERGGPASSSGSAAGAPILETKPAGPLQFDLTVDIPRRLFVRGLGLDSEWSGNLVIAGHADTLGVSGAIRPVRGQFDLAGATFRLDEGNIGFTGGESVVPRLDLRAVYEGNALRAIIRVSGPATAPEIALSSSPEMPQEEILSRVLFGQSAGSLSAAQAVRLADAAGSLTGIGGAGGLLERIRTTLGVDVLRLGGDQGGSTVTAGRYIGDNVFIGARQGMATSTTEATVELEVLPNLSVETDVGQNAKGRVGVKWKWDY